MTTNLILGDCLEELKRIPDGSIDLILTDPPYGTTACKWDTVIPFEPMWEELHRVIKKNGAIVLFGSEPFSSLLRVSNLKNFKYDWYWNKGQGLNFINAKRRPLNDTEIISVFGGKLNYYPLMEDAKKETIRPINKGSSKTSTIQVLKGGKAKSSENYDPSKRYPKTSIFINSRSSECNSLNRVHPTQKPVALLEYLIKTYTLESETVLDFTMGSGSTGVACVNLNRSFTGIEKDETYFSIAEKRILDARGEPT